MTDKNALTAAPNTELANVQNIGLVKPLNPTRPNPYLLLLQKARSPATRRTYESNLIRFFRDEMGTAPDQASVQIFLSQSAPELAMQLAVHAAKMRESGSAASSINIRLASIRALITTGYRFGFCAVDSKGLVDSEKAQTYRDTRGPELATIQKLLALPDRTTLRGKRDYALLRLLTDNALRRAEVCALQVSDFEPAARRLAILGKGQTDKIWVTLHPGTIQAIETYLADETYRAAAGHADGALFRNCAFRASAKGGPLAGDGLDDIVRTYGAKIGLKLSPHKFRHFAITAALDKTGGDVRSVQKLSRHKKIETLMIYDDNRTDRQGEITMLLGDLLEG